MRTSGKKDPKSTKSGKPGQGNPGGRNYQDEFADAERAKGARQAKFANRTCIKEPGADNTPTWYFKDKKILDDTASFSFTFPLGTPLRGVTPSDNGMYIIPGLMVIPLALTPGISVDAQSPVNLAAQDLYATVRYKNSGAANYDPPDLMLYCIGLDSIYSCWNWLKRIYGYASAYSSQNKYKPRAYAFAENVDLDDLYENLADFRRYINIAANRISAFACPATFTYNIRHSWLFANIYKDSNTRKAQEYMYTPLYFYQFDETSSPKGGILTPVNVNFNRSTGAYWTFAKLKELLDGMINAMQYSSENGNMAGDIIKQFGNDLFKLSSFDPDYRVEAVYSEEVLSQMENCRPAIFGNTVQLGDFTISQEPDTNFITFTMDLKNGSTIGSGTYQLNFHKENVQPEDVIVASRLIYAGAPGTTSPSWNVLSCGSEIAGRPYIIGFTYDPNTGKKTLTNFPMINVISSTSLIPQLLPQLIRYLWLWQCFDWAPGFTVNIAPGAEGAANILTPYFKDYDMFTSIDTEDIEAMNELALLTEFNMPN